ncbi:MAG: zinc ABC transporter substrate-binding protein [Chloroflexi bacterium]|nr:zinc ABC transporter substrate-binding protein [Chloroflexota bacterium]
MAILVVAITAMACNGGNQNSGVSVVTTLYPLEYFAQRIGGDGVSVVNLVKPGVEAHDYDPTPEDMRRLDSADVVLYNGSGFEPWMNRALSAISGRGGPRLILEASRGMVENHGTEGEDSSDYGRADPHVWLDPLRAMEQVKLIRDGLSSADSDGAAGYAQNAEDLLAELSELHQRFAAGLEGCVQDHFVASHAAFGHLAGRYGLEQVSISGLSPEAEPGPGDLASIADTIRELGVRYIMVEPIISARFAETLAREVGASLLPLHPLESLTPEESTDGEDYFTVMDSNLDNLRLALGCPQ